MSYWIAALVHLLVGVAAENQQYIAFDAATASSTYSIGNLEGSPAFAAQQALSGGSGYWCSGGNHAPGQSVTWTGVLNARRVALGVKVDWAYGPGEVKVLTSSDGSNFEEATCWKSISRSDVSYAESLMFRAPSNVKAVMISMRGLQSWGYFGINSVALVAEPGPFMLVSGITSPRGEQCIVSGASGVTLQSCLGAIAAGDGREVLQFDQDGQIRSLVDGTCLTLVDGDTTAGGALAMEACSSSAESSDGRSIFSMTPNGQVQLPRMGNFCLSTLGDRAIETDVALGADVSATSSNVQHVVKHAIDGDSHSFWASSSDPTATVDLHIDFGAIQNIRAVEIEWEYPAQAFELQVANGGLWSSVVSAAGNNLHVNRYRGLTLSGTGLRIQMIKPHPTLASVDGHTLYGIKSLRVMATSARLVVQDCGEAGDNTDARDKFFMSAVPDVDVGAAQIVRQTSGLLAAAEDHLGGLLASLYVAMPNLATCGFVAPSVAQSQQSSFASIAQAASSLVGGSSRVMEDDAAVAMASIADAHGLDLQGLHELVVGAQKLITNISR